VLEKKCQQQQEQQAVREALDVDVVAADVARAADVVTVIAVDAVVAEETTRRARVTGFP